MSVFCVFVDTHTVPTVEEGNRCGCSLVAFFQCFLSCYRVSYRCSLCSSSNYHTVVERMQVVVSSNVQQTLLKCSKNWYWASIWQKKICELLLIDEKGFS